MKEKNHCSMGKRPARGTIHKCGMLQIFIGAGSGERQRSKYDGWRRTDFFSTPAGISPSRWDKSRILVLRSGEEGVLLITWFYNFIIAGVGLMKFDYKWNGDICLNVSNKLLLQYIPSQFNFVQSSNVYSFIFWYADVFYTLWKTCGPKILHSFY